MLLRQSLFARLDKRVILRYTDVQDIEIGWERSVLIEVERRRLRLSLAFFACMYFFTLPGGGLLRMPYRSFAPFCRLEDLCRHSRDVVT